MSLNLQKELLEFQKELKELNSYSSEIKRMEKGLSEAEALAKAATKAADNISLKHQEHLVKLQNELIVYLDENTVSNQQIISDFVKQFTHQIKQEVERIEPLVNTLEDGVESQLSRFTTLLKSLNGTVDHLGPLLSNHLDTLQASNQEVSDSLTAQLLALHSNHTNSITDSLQEKTSLLIKTGKDLQAQSKYQGEELNNILGELNKASGSLAKVSETVSKTDFSAQLQKVEKELSEINKDIINLEGSVNKKSKEVIDLLNSETKEISLLVKNLYEDLLAEDEKQKQFINNQFERLTNLIDHLKFEIKSSEEKAIKNFDATTAFIKQVEIEVKKQVEITGKQQNQQFLELSKQLKSIKQLLIAGFSISSIVGLIWIGRILL